MKHQTLVFIVFILIFSPLLIQASLLPSAVPPQAILITGPTEGKPNEYYWFAVYIAPSNVDLPLTVTIYVTDHPPSEYTDGGNRLLAYFSWETPGVKEITVTAENAYGNVSNSMTIEIQESYRRVFIPLAVKQ
jgi:hypothetical protein